MPGDISWPKQLLSCIPYSCSYKTYICRITPKKTKHTMPSVTVLW